MATDRRTFLHLLGAGAFAGAFNASIRRALAIPAHHRTGTIADVEHIVILMQENRSFDHYFGTLRGVRGFGDPRAGQAALRAIRCGASRTARGAVLPFHPDRARPRAAVPRGPAARLDRPRTTPGTAASTTAGCRSKGTSTMAYLTRDDIPFHYALADAFTVCDAYHCSFLGPTDPNRYHMWTGWVGNDGKNGGPVLDNAEAGYDWSTYPERLQPAGISWKVYQDVGEGLDAAHFWGWTDDDAFIGNYGDNSLLYFHQYQNAQPGSPLYEGALRGTNIARAATLFDLLQHDVADNRLPQVSWIVAPGGLHGAWQLAAQLRRLVRLAGARHADLEPRGLQQDRALPDVRRERRPVRPHGAADAAAVARRGALDGRHRPTRSSPATPTSRPGRIGLGVRVPMIVISPWSKGGWVNSEVFDHTSLIRFIEQRFGARRRALREHEHHAVAPRRHRRSHLGVRLQTPERRPRHAAQHRRLRPAGQGSAPRLQAAAPTQQAVPPQEPGVRPARAVPYELQALGEADFDAGRSRSSSPTPATRRRCSRSARATIGDGPWTYTVGAGDELADSWNFRAGHETAYDLAVYGPNGFMRAFQGSLAGSRQGQRRGRRRSTSRTATP